MPSSRLAPISCASAAVMTPRRTAAASTKSGGPDGRAGRRQGSSKASVIGFTRALAREVGEFGITVNAVTPGMTQSETQVQSSSGNYLASRIAGRAIERAQYPEDLVGAVMFLASAASDFMTGQTINVDGGKAMH